MIVKIYLINEQSNLETKHTHRPTIMKKGEQQNKRKDKINKYINCSR